MSSFPWFNFITPISTTLIYHYSFKHCSWLTLKTLMCFILLVYIVPYNYMNMYTILSRPSILSTKAVSSNLTWAQFKECNFVGAVVNAKCQYHHCNIFYTLIDWLIFLHKQVFPRTHSVVTGTDSMHNTKRESNLAL